MDSPKEVEAPKDKWNLIYIALVINGLGTLAGWNMFITAKDYFVQYKLVNAPEYANNYLAYVGWACHLPNVIFNWLNIFVRFSGSLTTRIVWSACVETVIFIITIILAMVDSSDWPGTFFWITMTSVLVLNSFNAIFENSVYGVAARLPQKYMGAVVFGSNICGTLVVFFSWTSDLFSSPRTSATYYFIGGVLLMIICFDTYYALPLNRFYRYYDMIRQRTLRVNSLLVVQVPARAPYWTIVKEAWEQMYNIFVVFFVSLAIFPAVHSEIKPVTENFLGANFMSITCFLTFNLMATIGCITAGIWRYPTRRWLWVFTTVRFLFIPFFLFCNYKPEDRNLPVLIKSDWGYWIGAVLLGWSSGHGSALGLMYISGGKVPIKHATTAGMFGGACMVSGVFSGLLFTYICPYLV